MTDRTLPEVVPFLSDKGMVVWQNDYDRLLAAYAQKARECERQQGQITFWKKQIEEFQDTIERQQDRIRGLEKDAKEGWDAFYRLRDTVSKDKYPTLTNIVRADAASRQQEGDTK